MYTVKKILKAVIILIIVLWVAFFGIILYAVITDYKPAEKISIEENRTPVILNESDEISLMTWNIGYCGLDDKMDFFYDGGTRVRPSREAYEANLEAVTAFLKENDTLDFIFLQETDRKSKRSYKTDQFDIIKKKLNAGSSQFAINYDVFFVPVPPSDPMGKVFSGIAIYGQTAPSTSDRYAFPGTYGFPKQLFMLDRCFLVNRYPLENGKELILVNTHNEAFDPGNIRKEQMEYLKGFLLDEYSKGNYIIAGGDWNQTPPDFKPQFGKNKVNTSQMALQDGYLPAEWKWGFDSTVPSNRTVTTAYNPEVTATTVIDFFLLSPNIGEFSVRCIDLGFKNSDHNPVIMKVKLKTAGQ
ncbi:MAG TPA: endonuclease/exonuclease/phosphatase family protein [Bacteroidales bacterium]|nr:endonuclease/exonuclease/phosphatase family protein [Bacteroidales bacterium]